MSDESSGPFELYLQSFASITGDEKYIGAFPTHEKAEAARDEKLGGAMNRSKVDYDIRASDE